MGEQNKVPQHRGVSTGITEVDARDHDKKAATRIAVLLAADARPGWRWIRAEFAMTVLAENVSVVICFDDARGEIAMEPPLTVLGQVRIMRMAAAELRPGPWWRLILNLTRDGRLRVDYDYGRERFPSAQLLSPQSYRADLLVFPRESTPVWLAAYLCPTQSRSEVPSQAVEPVRQLGTHGGRSTVSNQGLPSLPVMWSRWATLSAASAATRSLWGATVSGTVARYEHSTHSGSELHILPGGRAVLSGGLWNGSWQERQPNAASRRAASGTDCLTGAPDWVADPVLDPCAGIGLLSFCFWFDDGHWHQAQSPPSTILHDAVPPIWTADAVIELVATELHDPAIRQAIASLLSAAGTATVTTDLVRAVFADGNRFSITDAMQQFVAAGLANHRCCPHQ